MQLSFIHNFLISCCATLVGMTLAITYHIEFRACTRVIVVYIPQLTTPDPRSKYINQNLSRTLELLPLLRSGISCSSQRGCMCLTPVITSDPRSIDDMQVANLPESAMDQGSVQGATCALFNFLILFRKSFRKTLDSYSISKIFSKHFT